MKYFLSKNRIRYRPFVGCGDFVAGGVQMPDILLLDDFNKIHFHERIYNPQDLEVINQKVE